MKRLFFYLVVLTFFTNFSVFAAESFIEGMEDIPVPENMKQAQAENISFGNEETRLVEAYLYADFLPFTRPAKFYKDTLPQLGWILEDSNSEKLCFIRGSENLDITKESDKPLIIRVTLTGKP